MDDYFSWKERLGIAFSKENLDSLNKDLNEWDLPTIPYDITLNEMQVLLAYHGNMLAYLNASLEMINMNIKKQEIKYEQTYNDIYVNINKQSADHKVATIKSIALKNQNVINEKEKLTNLQEQKSVIESRINALQEQNISLRKIGSIKTIAIQHGLE